MSQGLILEVTPTGADGQLAANCSYRQHPDNRGMESVVEMVRFALICRRCEAAPCVKACPRKALEKITPDGPEHGRLKRASMLCTGCGTCTIACPFGTIYPEMIRFWTSICDICYGRLLPGQRPLCVQTAGSGTVEFGQLGQAEDTVEIRDGVVARVSGGAKWEPLVRRAARA